MATYKVCGVEYSSKQAYLDHIKYLESRLTKDKRKDAISWLKENYPGVIKFKGDIKN